MDLKDRLLELHPVIEGHKNTHPGFKNIRKEALKVFETKGFPTRKEETWRYTSLLPLLREEYSFYPKTAEAIDFKDIEKYFISGIDSWKLVFVDGVFQPKLSSVTQDVIEVCPLSEAVNRPEFKEVFDSHYSKIIPEGDSLTALNTAFSNEGAFIYVKKNVTNDKPVEVMFFSTGSEKAIMLQPRNLVVVEDHAKAEILERHQSLAGNAVLTNSVTEIYCGKHSLVEYYKIQNDEQTASLIDNTYIVQKDDSEFFVHTFSFGGKLTRNNLKATQAGERINTTFKGVIIIKDKQHVDNVTFVHHTQPNCESHQDYKGVYNDRSHGVFDGYILVDKIAQKTDGYQKSDNLLLSDSAIAHSKPQLEIYADDVKCSHGCTIGQLDKEALFYLRSRGIPEKEAAALMMYAFANSVLSSVHIPELKDRIDKLIGSKLGVQMGIDL